MDTNSNRFNGVHYSVFIIIAVKLFLHMFSIESYGIFRDEFYYLQNADYLGFGYVDHPALIGYIAFFVKSVLGDSIIALRILPVLAGAFNLYLAAVIARELGGKPAAQFLAAFGVLFAPTLIGTNSVLSMNSFDQLFWTASVLYFIRYTKNYNPRQLYIFAVLAGLGFNNKISILFLLFGLFWGVMFTDYRHIYKKKELYIATLIIALFAMPYVIWQFVNDFATLEFMRNASADKIADFSTFEFITSHALGFGPANLFFLGGAILFAIFNPRFRYLGITYISIFILFQMLKSKPYYLAPAITFTIASGAVYISEWIERRNKKWILPAFVLFILPGSLFPLPMATPLLSPEGYVDYTKAIGMKPKNSEVYDSGALPQFYADMFGWEEIADTVSAVYQRLPEADQENLHVFCWNYGEAGALTYYGKRKPIPKVISSHNSHFLWGPKDYDGKNLLFIGSDKEWLETMFESVEDLSETKCTLCMPYENGNAIRLCKNLKMPVDEFWQKLKNYN